jgi:hypothetical protein
LKGRSHKVKALLMEGRYGWEDNAGRVDLGWSREEVADLMRKYRSGNPKYEDLVERLLDPDTTPLTDNSYRTFIGYADESAPMPTAVPGLTQEVAAEVVTKVKALRRGVLRLPRQAQVHSTKTPAEVAEVTEYLDSNSAALEKLGYDASKYKYPEITSTIEATSVVKHLELYHDRLMTLTKPPTVKEGDRAVMIVSEMMRHNRFQPDAGWRSRGRILEVIDSSAIKDSKSPGHPYQSAGHATNAQVLKSFTKEGFAELVEREWDTPEIEVKCIVKGEPTKIAKLERDMPRIVTCMPLHKTVKNNCVFAPLNEALVGGWKKSPVKYSFNP